MSALPVDARPGIEKHPALAGMPGDLLAAERTEGEDNADDTPSIDLDEEDENGVVPVAPVPPPAPTGELTLAAIFSPALPWRRRIILLAASVAINIGLPFINGVFLGFGEIFARAFLAPWMGLAPPLRLLPNSASPADVAPLPSIPPGGIRSGARRRESKDL